MTNFEKPSNWSQLSAIERRSYIHRISEIDERMVAALHALPLLTAATRPAIEAKLATFSDVERQRFDAVLADTIGVAR